LSVPLECEHPKPSPQIIMPKKIPAKALFSAVTDSTIEALSDIDRLHVCSFGPDAASAVRSGAVLLAISRVDNDGDGDGFRYLIGLHRGTEVTPHLGNFF
jgi:hypothetical protein